MKVIELTGEVPQEDYFDSLIFAIYIEDIDFFRYLMDHKANPNFREKSSGMTAHEYLNMMIKLSRGNPVKLEELQGILDLHSK
jgi:hypothetical protein